MDRKANMGRSFENTYGIHDTYTGYLYYTVGNNYE